MSTRRQRQVAAGAGGAYLHPGPLALAHRGGAGYALNEGIENSLRAVRNAVDLGFTYVETDVRASADGVPFVFHDPDLSRVVGSAVDVHALTAADLRAATLAGGESIPTLAELLEEFGGTRFNIDVKSDDVVAPALAVIEAQRAFDRVLIAAFDHRRLQRVRRAHPEAATSGSPLETASLRWGVGAARSLAARNGVVCLQVPTTFRGRALVTGPFVATAHRYGLQVHVWTIDDADTMNALFDLGVDGIVADRIDVLRDVLIARGAWPQP
ncbi:glycerophosphodiester phosphodiesterase family protein [Occultella aeris]|uniref:Glycerophosphoryl diester phosphodiesterase n=1 Tax=Occultella aeris TaxID=2761496 RepID=A0A7M4DPY2_9MICO|nr:glycerophosphodiester phosphodiesterase family protein [Occultella aeris]VZO39526.1 Glycerophosphoryl diester phosphodiesterase [Occultella aeris]